MNMNLGWSTFKLKSDSGNEDNSDPNKEFSLNLTPRIGYQSYIDKEKEANENNLRYIIGTFGLKLGLTVIL